MYGAGLSPVTPPPLATEVSARHSLTHSHVSLHLRWTCDRVLTAYTFCRQVVDRDRETQKKKHDIYMQLARIIFQ